MSIEGRGYVSEDLPHKVFVLRADGDMLRYLSARRATFNYDPHVGAVTDLSVEFSFEDKAEAALFRLMFG